MIDKLSALVAQRHSIAQIPYVDPRILAELHGTVEVFERCRVCGAIGKACYFRDGWGFIPRGRCGNPLKCSDKPNCNSDGFPIIKGGLL